MRVGQVLRASFVILVRLVVDINVDDRPAGRLATMRLKSELWVAALLRTNSIAGRYGAIIRKGAAEAGAVYVIVNCLDGTGRLYEPPPGPSHDEEGRRLLIDETGAPQPLSGIEARLARRASIYPDIWAVEIENRSGEYETPA